MRPQGDPADMHQIRDVDYMTDCATCRSEPRNQRRIIRSILCAVAVFASTSSFADSEYGLCRALMASCKNINGQDSACQIISDVFLSQSDFQNYYSAWIKFLKSHYKKAEFTDDVGECVEIASSKSIASQIHDVVASQRIGLRSSDFPDGTDSRFGPGGDVTFNGLALPWHPGGNGSSAQTLAGGATSATAAEASQLIFDRGLVRCVSLGRDSNGYYFQNHCSAAVTIEFQCTDAASGKTEAPGLLPSVEPGAREYAPCYQPRKNTDYAVCPKSDGFFAADGEHNWKPNTPFKCRRMQ